jgi:ATP-binding protein involved in chromosome partitioning
LTPSCSLPYSSGFVDPKEVEMAGNIKNLILVASGKGGVGKSTVAANLALALSKKGFATGLLDADVYGPSVPTMFGASEKPVSKDGKKMQPIERHGLKLMSMGYLVDPNAAMVWRGPMLAGAVTQFVDDVDWGDLDYLIFDLPPGTGDIQLTLAQKFKVTGAVLVTTPQTVALADVVRAKAMFDKVRIQTLGLIENMSYFICPNCDERHEIFSYGGGETAAKDLELEFFGRVPIEPALREGGDAGVPLMASAPESVTGQSFMDIAGAIQTRVDKVNEQAVVKQKQSRGLNIIRT